MSVNKFKPCTYIPTHTHNNLLQPVGSQSGNRSYGGVQIFKIKYPRQPGWIFRIKVPKCIRSLWEASGLLTNKNLSESAHLLSTYFMNVVSYLTLHLTFLLANTLQMTLLLVFWTFQLCVQLISMLTLPLTLPVFTLLTGSLR